MTDPFAFPDPPASWEPVIMPLIERIAAHGGPGVGAMMFAAWDQHQRLGRKATDAEFAQLLRDVLDRLEGGTA